jgi:alkanesulfonate monooxygenase SsuD/methylene tetrahydromethanopterin reductase-like flavin-dependent oxidoreductase (luciferase family)
MYIGSPETVATKIAATVRTLGASRFQMKFASGSISHDRLMSSIELYGTRVLPLVREMLADTGTDPATP